MLSFPSHTSYYTLLYGKLTCLLRFFTFNSQCSSAFSSPILISSHKLYFFVFEPFQIVAARRGKKILMPSLQIHPSQRYYEKENYCYVYLFVVVWQATFCSLRTSLCNIIHVLLLEARMKFLKAPTTNTTRKILHVKKDESYNAACLFVLSYLASNSLYENVQEGGREMSKDYYQMTITALLHINTLNLVQSAHFRCSALNRNKNFSQRKLLWIKLIECIISFSSSSSS
jgi:hypothetical protein